MNRLISLTLIHLIQTHLVKCALSFIDYSDSNHSAFYLLGQVVEASTAPFVMCVRNC